MSSAAFAFLSQPPTSLGATRSRKSHQRSISAWASAVQPGSPTPRSPHSPRRRLSLSSSSPRIRRRPTNNHSPKSIIDFGKTPTTSSPTSAKPEHLLAQGYTSFFVKLPHHAFEDESATTPEFKIPQTPLSAIQPTAIEKQQLETTTMMKPKGKKALQRFRSLSILRPKRARSPPPPLPVQQKKKTTTEDLKSRYPTSPSPPAASNRKSKRHAQQIPPSLANELLLMQFADGGKLDAHAARLMQAHAEQQSAAGAGAGVGVVYKDEEGTMWWDKEDMDAYQRLIAPPSRPESDSFGWVKFDRKAEGEMDEESNVPMVIDLVEERRGSLGTLTASSDSTADLANRTPLQPGDPRAFAFSSNVLPVNDGFTFSSASMSRQGEEKEKLKGIARRKRPSPLVLMPSPVIAVPAPNTAVEPNPFEDSFSPAVVAAPSNTNSMALTVNGRTPPEMAVRQLRNKSSFARLGFGFSKLRA